MFFELGEVTIVTIINAISIFFIIIIGSNSLKTQLNRWFTVMTLFMIGWVNFSYLGFIEQNLTRGLIFYRLNWFFVTGFLFSAYIFYIKLFFKIKKQFLELFLALASVIIMFLTIFTNTIIKEVVLREWGNDIIFGPFYTAFDLFTLLITSIIIYYFISKFKKLPVLDKQKASYFLWGSFFLIFFNILFNVLSPRVFNTTKFQHFGDYSVIVFLAFTAFAIIKHKFLKIKIVLGASLISIISMLLIIDIVALSDNFLEQSIKTILFTLFVGVSVILVRSILSEIKQKEVLIKTNIILDKSKKRYIKLASTQKDIIDIMGHEIRTPLTAVSQEMKIHRKYTFPIENQLLTEVKPKSKLKKYLPIIFETIKITDKAVSHALSLVTDMLETARLDKKKLVLNYEKFDLLPVIKGSLALMSKTINEKVSHLVYEIKFVDPKMANLIVEADKVRISQAINALLNNALKYRNPSKKINKIWLRVTLIKHLLKVKKKLVKIEIKDNGLGLKASDIPHLGRKFFRVDNNKSIKRPGGTGLGLFVVKGIMKYHHGKLLIASKGEGQGSTFTLFFPLVR